MKKHSIPFLVFSLALASCGGGTSGGGGFVASVTPSPTPTSAASPAAFGTDDWSTFQHDMQRTGLESRNIGVTSSNVSQLALRWNFQSSSGFQGSPIVVAGIVYVVDKQGVVTALRASDGSKVWQQQLTLPAGSDVVMTPSLYDGLLFVGSRSYSSDSSPQGEHSGPSPLFALDAKTGAPRWTAQLPGLAHSAPVAINGTLYVAWAGGDPDIGCRAGGIKALNEQTGAEAMNWFSVANSTDGGGIWAPLSTDGTTLYFGTGNTCVTSQYNDSIVSSPLSLAAPHWSINTDPSLFNDDDVGGGILLADGNGYVLGKSGVFYSVNLNSGHINWTFATNAPLSYAGFSTPTMTRSTIIVGAGYRELANGVPQGGQLFGVSLGGAKQWSINTTKAVMTSVATTSDLAFAELDASIAALNPQTGQILWQQQTQSPFKASPALGPSGLFVADLSGMVYAYGLPGAATTTARRHLAAMHKVNIDPTIPKMCFPSRQ